MILKTCTKCGEEKEANTDNFNRNKEGKNGLYPKCKICTNEYGRKYSMNWRKLNKDKIRKRRKGKYNENRKYIEKYFKKYPKRKISSHTIGNMLRRGKLEKEPCVICGEKIVQGHHPDYDKPKEVIWLCPLHHKQLHLGHIKLPVIIKKHMTLRQSQIKKLRDDVIRLHKGTKTKKGKSKTDISIEVGVSYQRVWQIIQTWKSQAGK